MFTSGVSQVSVIPEESQAIYDREGTNFHVAKFVQNSNNMLRFVGPKGELQNGLRLCGMGQGAYMFWWDDVPYMNCPVAEFRIVPL